MNTILDMNERLSITENDVFIAISKMNFDLSIYDMFGCLIAGATLVIPDDDTVNPERWAELINHYGVTIWNSVPALMQILFVNEEAKGCKRISLQVLLHAGFGTMNCFRYLIEYMRLDNKGTIAGIAIKNSKRYCEMNPDNLIEILADEYVNLIIGLNKKKIQIIGYCISGLIAVEIARRLMERGLEIFDLVLIDSHPIQYQLEDELLMEITFLPSLGIEISQLGLGEISNEELYKAVLYLYNEFKKEIPSRSIQYLPDEYINLKKILLKLDCMEKRQRFELYSKMALEKAENQFPVDMCIDLFAAYKQSFKAAQFVPEVYAGNIRFLLAEESTSFIPDNDEETLAFWKNTCLDDMSVEMIKGNHITCTENKENACTLCKKISKCFQD